MPNILPFSHPQAQQVDLTGGKGASLAKSAAAGFPVPPGAIVTAEAFRRWRGEPELSAELAAEVRAWLATQPADRTFAVRSSATAEDGTQHAFAGQHETFLHVPPDEVPRRILDCWHSRDGDRAVAYRRQAGLRDDEVLMAVVIQTMIPAECAGVGFCLDPIKGRTDVFSIDASFGLGETVVGGSYPTDNFTINRDTGAIVSAHVAHKEHFIGTGPSGTEERPSTTPDAPACTPAQLVELAALLRKIEKHYGYPQDIEWAFHQGQLYLLQSRPITRLPEHWTREESAERFPNPVSRLNWELAEEGFHRSLVFSFALMGLPAYQGKWFARFDQFIYGQQTAVELFGRLAQQLIPDLSPANFSHSLGQIREKFPWVTDLPSLWWRDFDTYLLQLGAIDSLPPPASIRDAWARARHLQKVGSDYFLPNIAISITQRTLVQLLLQILQAVAGKEQGAALHANLLAWCDTKTGRVNQDLWELAQLIRRSPFRAMLIEQGGEALLASDWKTASPVAYAALQRILQVHGHREWDFDPYVAPWRETPGLVLEMVRGLVDRDLSPNGEGRAARIRMQETEAQVMRHCPPDGQFFLSELVRLARTYTSLDDIEHYQTLRLNLPMRQTLHQLGAFFVERAIIEEPLDIAFASCALIESFVAGECPEATFGAEVKAEKQRYRAAYGSDPLVDRSSPGTAPVGVLQGIPGSPGVATGLIQHVRSQNDFATFKTGSILVARTTNPAWTPLFFRAAGIVTESGGPLSHGAVTAREIGIPAVMAIPNVFKTLPDGKIATINGSEGRVQVRSA
jgi:phosphohistidine swiveling domain-containing protein